MILNLVQIWWRKFTDTKNKGLQNGKVLTEIAEETKQFDNN